SSTIADGGDTTVVSVPYSSEGPTLPVLGNTDALVGVVGRGGIQEDDGGVRKRRRLDNGDTTTQTEAEGADKEIGSTHDLAELYEPWCLLPAELRISVEKRMQSFSWEDGVSVVVFTRNQNIKSGINRLSDLLTTPAETTNESSIDPQLPKSTEREGAAKGDVIAISAQGEATTKLVGIVELTKRHFKPTTSDLERASGKMDVQKWYSYISLTSCVIDTRTRKAKTKGKQQEDDKDDEDEQDAFESVLEIQEKEEEARKAMKTVPVLTTWMSKNRIPEFAESFGE
ncbi:hypothetical protein K491DRAFT_580293, partial [Lophiostoma macrostomum CBS 122681]